MPIISKITKNKKQFYDALVWIISALSLFLYGYIAHTNQKVPGVEELVGFINSLDPHYIFIGGFLSIFLEGLYVFGSFIPGTSLVALLAIISQGGGYFVFIYTMFFILLGWILAGLVNIFLAKTYHRKILSMGTDENFDIKDNAHLTWFPAFRANYEVSQIIEGGDTKKVILSSVRVKAIVIFVMSFVGLFIPLFINVNEISNEEGTLAVVVVASIILAVGVYKLFTKDSTN